MKAFLPPNETQRLDTLWRYDVLDTPPEQAFDDLTQLAAQICGVPTAMVSLVDEKRQWFKSRIGMEAAETSRDIAFCAHTILHADEVLEVRDAEVDPRFCDSPLVTADPHIRFYAGAPLVAPNGHALGALCVMDRAPRTLTAEQLAALRSLSRHVVAQLELRRQSRELAQEVAERKRAELRLRQQYEQIVQSEQAAGRLLHVAEKSRQALLSVLEDERLSGEKLRTSEERFRQLADNINEVFWMTDPTLHTILYVSRAYEVIWGRTCESLYAHPFQWVEAIHPEDRARVLEVATNCQVSGSFDENYRIVRPDGSQRWIHDRGFSVRDEKGVVYRIVGTAEDITDRKHSELALRTSEGRFKALFDQAAVGVGLADVTTGRFVQVNRRFCDIAGRTRAQMEQLTFAAITHPDDVDHNLEIMREMKAGTLRESTLEKRYVRPDKSEVWVNLTVSPMWAPGEAPGLCIAVIQDITEQKRFEEQFHQAQKMEAIGTLAGGIAHDFNNILTAIIGYTELSRMVLEGNPEVESHLGAVLQATSRATDLVRQILAFSRRDPQERRVIELHSVVVESLKLLRASIPSTIEFETSLSADAPTVFANASQVHQVLMNLGTNAWHAIGNRNGRLRVTLEKCVVDEAHAAAQERLSPGIYARISVSDTGSGMDQATLRRIFEPFFTTKPPGEGTGLGLAVVHGIMGNHDGVVTVYSQPGDGTIFHLYFPAHGGETTMVADEKERIPLGQGESILFVEDEELLARLGKKTLLSLGYRVESTTRPAEALAMVEADPQRFAAVLTDLTMPEMTGLVLAGRLLKIRPDLPIVLMTGYSATLTPERVRSAGIRQLLLKPVGIHSLGTAVRAVLQPQPRS